MSEFQKYPTDKKKFDQNYLRIFGKKCLRCGGDGCWHSVVGFQTARPLIKCPECDGFGYVERKKK